MKLASRSTRVPRLEDLFSEVYEFKEGNQGTIYHGFSKSYGGQPPGVRCAIKIRQLSGTDRMARRSSKAQQEPHPKEPRLTVDLKGKREAGFLKQLDHPNVVRYISDGYATLFGKKQHYLATEFVGPDTLWSVLKEHKFSKSEVICVAYHLAKALQYLDSRQVLHNDIKPENIGVVRKPTSFGLDFFPVLYDFGSARSKNPRSWIKGEVAGGTLGYQSPEAHFGYDRFADEFGVGAVLHRLAFNTDIYTKKSKPTWQEILQVMSGEMQPISEEDALDKIINGLVVGRALRDQEKKTRYTGAFIVNAIHKALYRLSGGLPSYINYAPQK